MFDDQIVAAKPVGDRRRLSLRVVGDDRIRTARDRVQFSVGPEGLPISLATIGDELADLAVQPQLVGFAVRDVVVKHLAPH